MDFMATDPDPQHWIGLFLPPCMQGEDDGTRMGEAAVGRVRGARVPGGSQVPNVLPQVHLDGQRTGEQGRHQPVSQRGSSGL